jgi:hypothetical protein
MIAITITPAAFAALKVMRPSTRDTPVSLDGMVRIWLDRTFVDRLGQMRDPAVTAHPSPSCRQLSGPFSSACLTAR